MNPDILNAACKLKVMLIGEVIIDEYNYVQPMAKAQKENVIATRFKSVERFAGGVIATANTMADFVGKVDIVTAVGEDFKEFTLSSLKENCSLNGGKIAKSVQKKRWVDPTYTRKLFEVYDMEEQHGDICDYVEENIGKYDLVVVNDFGHGLINKSVVKLICQSANFLAVNTQSNSANMGYNLVHKYPSADYVCIDEPEARLAAIDQHGSMKQVIATLRQKIDCGKFIVTHGKYGCVVDDEVKNDIIPALTQTVVDTMGAGDAFLAVTAPLVAAGVDLHESAFMGNVAGAVKTGIIGHKKAVSKAAMLEMMEHVRTAG